MAERGAPAMRPYKQGLPMGAPSGSLVLRIPRAWNWLWAAQRTTHTEACPASLGTSQASDSGDAPLEKHFHQAELSGNLLFLKGFPKL